MSPAGGVPNEELDQRHGGSARSHADDPESRTWQARPWAARAIRTARTGLTLFAAVATVRLVAELVPQPETLPFLLGWLALLVALSLSIVQLMDRATRRLMPLVMLYQLSLVFPDRAPQRFSQALREGPARSHRKNRPCAAAEPQPGSSPTCQTTGHVTVQSHAEHVLALLTGLTSHDRRTRGHTERVRAYAQLIGTEIGLSKVQLDQLAWGAMLHDIGKLQVPAALLNKGGPPTGPEWAVLRRHPEWAEPHIAPLREWLGPWADAATQHHERYDGTGYPQGLAGSDISLAGRIVAIADAYDVMTSVRSYKRALPPAMARAELSLNAGSQFDPQLVRAFMGVSVGRSRLMLGPLGWCSQLPEVLHIPLAGAASAVASGAVSTIVVAAMAVASMLPGVLDRSKAAPDIIASGTEPAPASDTATVAHPQTPAPDGEGGAELARRDPLHGRTEPDPTAGPDPTAPKGNSPEPGTPEPTGTTADPGTSDPDDPAVSTTVPAPQATGSSSTTTPEPTVPTPGTGTRFAVDDTATATALGPRIVIRVLDNDDFAGSGPNIATLVVVVPGYLGLHEVNGNHIRYQAGAQPGQDSFRYRICNDAGDCAEATVFVTVNA